MYIRGHLVELRTRIMRISVVTLVGMIVSFVMHKPILAFLMYPAFGLADSAAGGPVFTDPLEFLSIAMRVSLVSGLVLASPVLLYEIIMFAGPGLTKRERRFVVAFMPAALLSFTVGAAFAYYVLFPPAFTFLLSFGSDVATPMIRIGSLINLVVMLMFWMGVIFEIPIVLFFLARMGIVNAARLRRYRRYVVVVAFIMGAVVTPTMDPINQSIVAGSVVLLYELGILLAWIGGKRA
jgi:sec-independent protein translocase protein TatC